MGGIKVSKKVILYIIGGVIFLMMYSVAMLQTGIVIGRATAKAQAESREITVKPHYIVKEYEGAIRVFTEGSDAPMRVLNISIENLRQSDREKFIDGIRLETLEDVTQLEEDFSS